MELKDICAEVLVIAKEVGGYIWEQQKEFVSDSIEVKGLHNFVTDVDKASEKMIIDALLPLIPEAGFIAEEDTFSKKGERYNWVIDPLDGTTNFIHGLPPYAVSIGLMDGDDVVLGVIYEIGLDECFYAWTDGGAFLNGKKISVTKITEVNDSLLATGFPYTDFSKMDKYMDLMSYFMKNTHGLRRLGSAATDIAYVACGRFEGFYEYGLNPWDVAAGVVILKEAGGQVCDFSGNNDYIFGKEIIATNNNAFNNIKKVISDYMG